MASKAILDIGWVGLGSMGFGMATNLVRRGHRVTAYDINELALEHFTAAGGIAAKTLRESANGKMIYVCMVASAAQLEQILVEGEGPLVEYLERGATFLVTSTVGANDISRIEALLALHKRNDVLLVDCPVSGGAKRAAEGTLSIMAAGSNEALQSAANVLVEMADPGKLFYPGALGQGSNLKMVHQVLADVHIIATSEALAFASHLGLDLMEIRKAVLDPNSGAASWMFENRSMRTIEHRPHPPESSLNLVVKDTGIITYTALEHRFPVPLCSTAEQLCFFGLLHGFGADDDATMARLYCPRLNPPQRTPDKEYAENPGPNPMHTSMVLDLLIGIHTVIVAEALCFAHTLGLDLWMVVQLVNMSAGSSSAFSKHAAGIVHKLQKPDFDIASGSSLKDLRNALSLAVSQARLISCPLLIGNAALEVITEVERRSRKSGKELSIVDLVQYYQ